MPYHSDTHRGSNPQNQPDKCPECSRREWVDEDWETGLFYCQFCGYYEDLEES